VVGCLADYWEFIGGGEAQLADVVATGFGVDHYGPEAEWNAGGLNAEEPVAEGAGGGEGAGLGGKEFAGCFHVLIFA
jgi:hypothetical protein